MTKTNAAKDLKKVPCKGIVAQAEAVGGKGGVGCST